jgi:hypothetical protein
VANDIRQTFVLRDVQIAENACRFISSLPHKPLHEIIVRPHKKDRTVAQNSLMWLWFTHLAGELGETKDEIHYRYKKQYLVHIYERDNPDYAAMVEAVRKVYREGDKETAEHLHDGIVKLTSTRDANVEQFTEYLTDIDRDALDKHISLPRPEDRYYLAMGIK